MGNFARTRSFNVFKKKASMKKRQRRALAPTTGRVFDWRVQRIKDIKAGVQRRTALTYDAAVDAQYRGLA